MSTGLQIVLPFEVVFQHEFNCRSLKWARFETVVACENIRFSSLFVDGDVSPAAKSEEKRMFLQARTAADFDCYLHQSSCFGLRQSLVGLAVTLSLVFLWVCLFHFGYQQEIRLSHSEKRL